MKFDFKSVAERDIFSSVPEGIHACRVTEVREGNARDGSPRWNMKLEVIDGEFAGKVAGWDSLTWSERGVHRVQQVLIALGVDARGEVDLEPGELVGCEAHVQFELEEREDPNTGRRQVRLRVPYSGFGPFDGMVADAPAPNGAGTPGAPVAWGASRANGNGIAGIDAEGGAGGSSADGTSLEDSAAAAF